MRVISWVPEDLLALLVGLFDGFSYLVSYNNKKSINKYNKI
jgi:hypothetical protein